MVTQEPSASAYARGVKPSHRYRMHVGLRCTAAMLRDTVSDALRHGAAVAFRGPMRKDQLRCSSGARAAPNKQRFHATGESSVSPEVTALALVM